MREQIVAAVLTETLEATSLPAYFCPARGRSPARLQNLRQPRGTWRWMLACRAVGPQNNRSSGHTVWQPS